VRTRLSALANQEAILRPKGVSPYRWVARIRVITPFGVPGAVVARGSESAPTGCTFRRTLHNRAVCTFSQWQVCRGRGRRSQLGQLEQPYPLLGPPGVSGTLSL
jgi:hypothetical protein